MPSLTFPEPALFVANQGEPSLRWGILGPGVIATAFVKAMRGHTRQQPFAVASRSRARAEAFAQAWSIPRAYDSYQALVDDPQVDIVYIATPHSEHLAQGLLALRAGKHVLIEKPITTFAADARVLVQEARARGLFLMEAMWSRYLPHALVLRALAENGVLGSVRHVFADLSQLGPSDPAHRQRNPALGGGALLDLGVYTVQLSSMLLGTPTAITATGVLTDTGVDAFSTLVLSHGQHAQSTLISSIVGRSTSTAYVSGTEARVDLGASFHNPTTLQLAGNSDATAAALWQDPTGIRGYDGLCWQATAAARFIGEGRTESPLHPLDEVVQIMTTLDTARAQLGMRS
ncbi:Gfo/Idh/MocA family protein [Xanthomonas campestris]|uniref:Gfo/Idh/MocA family protein n=1 Tax=Xanthomonas campestris TaxID=339 RepID=UPI0025A034AC|nr:Gfo/Idh/MocA family oxidoreductase [Xanthomonas campestris]MDM7583610.1 Gfo/Idh/MocA family oxidoreductase [Xanthomonas campestris]MDM7590465.1 Gfo/Idh/MocA family oxidoreductase [Xanthomonas campestris]MEA9862640.1 Gfo/Idh/MocA family oxidoreductase [Xanthomonas campestris pv. raphani]